MRDFGQKRKRFFCKTLRWVPKDAPIKKNAVEAFFYKPRNLSTLPLGRYPVLESTA